MLAYSVYLIEDKPQTIINMKILKICGNFELNKNEIIRKIGNSVREFLNKNKDVNYLIVYYYPTQEDMKINAAICHLKLDKNIKDIDLSNEEICKRLRWNEDYGFFSGVVKEKTSSDYRLVKETNTMLQIMDEACFILYDLGVTARYKKYSVTDGFNKYLENWIIKAEHIDVDYEELEFIVKDDFMHLVRHISNILYCCLSDAGKNTKDEKEIQWIFDHELTNAMDKFEVIYRQLSHIMGKYLK